MLPIRRPTVYSSIYAVLPADRPVVWTAEERRALVLLHARWHRLGERFSCREEQRLYWLAWMVERGKVGRG